MSVLANAVMIALGSLAAPVTVNFTITVGKSVYAPATGLQWMITGYSASPAAGSISPSPPVINGYTIHSIDNEVGAQTDNAGCIRMYGDVPSFWKAIIVNGVRYPVTNFTRFYGGGTGTTWVMKNSANFGSVFSTVGTLVSISFEL